jgi:hypothetical protein
MAFTVGIRVHVGNHLFSRKEDMAIAIEEHHVGLKIVDVIIDPTRTVAGRTKVALALENGERVHAFEYREEPPAQLDLLVGKTVREAAFFVAGGR